MPIKGQFTPNFWKIMNANIDAELAKDPEWTDYFEARHNWALGRIDDIEVEQVAHRTRMCLIRYHEQNKLLALLLPPSVLR